MNETKIRLTKGWIKRFKGLLKEVQAEKEFLEKEMAKAELRLTTLGLFEEQYTEQIKTLEEELAELEGEREKSSI